MRLLAQGFRRHAGRAVVAVGQTLQGRQVLPHLVIFGRTRIQLGLIFVHRRDLGLELSLGHAVNIESLRREVPICEVPLVIDTQTLLLLDLVLTLLELGDPLVHLIFFLKADHVFALLLPEIAGHGFHQIQWPFLRHRHDAWPEQFIGLAVPEVSDFPHVLSREDLIPRHLIVGLVVEIQMTRADDRQLLGLVPHRAIRLTRVVVIHLHCLLGARLPEAPALIPVRFLRPHVLVQI